MSRPITVMGVGTTPATKTKVNICDSTGMINVQVEVQDDGGKAKIKLKDKEIEVSEDGSQFVIRVNGRVIKV